mgnify:CR=1 FL=1
MAYPLKKLFHMDRAKYEEEYLKRFNSPDAVHFDFKISGEQAFMCQTPEILNTIISIERTDKHVKSERSFRTIPLSVGAVDAVESALKQHRGRPQHAQGT